MTDIAPGYDHIVSAIGATAAATYGASLLCYVTPAEHLGLPDADEVHQGCIAYKIAAHAGDVARGLPGARRRDDEMAEARATFDWDRQFAACLDPARARARWLKTRAFTDEAHDDDHCSMCGKQFFYRFKFNNDFIFNNDIHLVKLFHLDALVIARK